MNPLNWLPSLLFKVTAKSSKRQADHICNRFVVICYAIYIQQNEGEIVGKP
jgi:hypothetical protein